MRKNRVLTILLSLIALLALVACGGEEPQGTPDPASSEGGAGLGDDTLVEDSAVESGGEGIDSWLQRLQAGEIPAESRNGSFEWGLGYLVYYGPIESLGVDNLIYNAILAHRRLETGEVTADSMSQNDRNLIELTDGITFDPEVDATEQVGQTPEIRQAILDRIVDNQSELSPDEALASNEVVGVFAPPSPDDLGRKYLVYTQETPDSDFTFLGVVIVADAVDGGDRETYSFNGWEQLPWLGDASGPFWEDLPLGVSGDPTNTDEGRPGVLLISEAAYEEIR